MHARELLQHVIGRLERRRADIDQTILVLLQELGTDSVFDGTAGTTAGVGASNGAHGAHNANGVHTRPGAIINEYFTKYPDHRVSAGDVKAWAEAAGYVTDYDPIYNAMVSKTKSGKLARDTAKKFYLPEG